MQFKTVKNRFSIVSIFIILIVGIFSFTSKAASEPIEEVRQKIRENYVTEVSSDILNRPTIKEIIDGLNDPYSSYFTKEEGENFKNAINNKISGIGIYLKLYLEGIEVTGIVEGSPAKEAGLKVGDIIVEADGVKFDKENPELALSHIKGQAGTVVKLVVKREDKILTFDVPRREISMPTVNSKTLSNNTAYISIESFGWDTGELFTKKLQELRMQNPNRYIIDLRGNGGGYMVSALKIAGHFIDENIGLIVENKNGEKLGYLAGKQDFIIDKPTIFLIDENTASASEILSAAVKDYNRAYFIGKTTYGKGVAQDMYDLSDGSSLKLTVEKFFSPSGKTINKVGIAPNFMVEDVDSLAVAELFSGKCRNELDKSGFIKIDAEGKSFEIDASLAKKDERYWQAFKYIISKVSNDNVYIGTNNGWKKASQDYFDNLYKFLYGDYKILNSANNVPENKVFNIKFNKKVKYDSVKDALNIEVINSSTGERAAFDIKQKDDDSINLIPKENLKSGESYYVKVKDTIKPVTVK